MISCFPLNERGRDPAVGDIHGYFALLQRALDRADFDPACDRLFSVGDLTDRGPECAEALDWLDRLWFHPVCGNHDDYVCRHQSCDRENWIQNGGSWFQRLIRAEQDRFAARYRMLPIAIEVATPADPVGLLHADCPFPSWQSLLDRLDGGVIGGQLRAIKNVCLWSRRRIELLDESGIEDLVALVVGHTPVSAPARLGNVFYIDTGGWYPHEGGLLHPARSAQPDAGKPISLPLSRAPQHQAWCPIWFPQPYDLPAGPHGHYPFSATLCSRGKRDRRTGMNLY